MITETAPSTAPSRLVSPQSGQERRQVEQAIAYWRQMVAEFGGPPPFVGIEITRMVKREWSHRFLISTDARLENYAFLIYGAAVAQQLDLVDQVALRAFSDWGGGGQAAP